MGYLKFNDQNIGEVFSLDRPEDITGWYEIPEDYHTLSHFKLVDGVVIPFTEEEILQRNRDSFKKSYQIDLKIHISNVLSDTDWLVQRHKEEIDAGSTTLTTEEYQSLIQYRANLRAITNMDLYPNEYVIPEYPLSERYPINGLKLLLEFIAMIPEDLYS